MFPTVQDLLGMVEAPPQRSSPLSIFEGLLGGRAEVLTQDAAAHPERYDDATRAFLTELEAGHRSLAALTPADRAALDQATLDFAAYRPPAPPPVPRPRAAHAPRLMSSDVPLSDGRAPQVEEPGGVVAPYWWV